MKRKMKLGIMLTLCLSMVSIVFSLYLFPRVFGDTETKAMYKIESILKSYINIKSDNLIDFINNTFHTGSYEYENDNLKFSFGVKTGENITDVLSDVSSLCNEITTYTKNNSDINGKNVEISIRIEHWAEWVVIIEPNLNRIAIGLGHQMSITQMLSYCKEFEIIDIGGYWGYDVSIPEDIDNSRWEISEALGQ